MFEYEWVCRWDHVDPANQAYFVELANACHQAGDAFMEHVGSPYWDNPENHGIETPVVEAGYEFERPVEAGDRITIEVEPRMGTSSLRFEFTARHEDGETAFTGFEQHVCVSVDGEGSTPLPEEFREAVSEYVGGES